MDRHVKEFYRPFSAEFPEGKFHKVIAVHEAPDVDWNALHSQFPVLCKGWYELSLLSPSDRIEFSREYWLSKLPYHPNLSEFLMRFFDSLDDVGIYLYQKKFDDPFEGNIVYSIKNNNGFFRGGAGVSEKDMLEAAAKFKDCIFPADYLAFLQIHNGFWKTTDCTGLIKLEDLSETYERFVSQVLNSEQPVVTTKGVQIDPKKLIPFYESFGMPFYQCFWSEWYPQQEMGNVYFSGNAFTISDVSQEGTDSLAFPTFLDWLMFYLERID